MGVGELPANFMEEVANKMVEAMANGADVMDGHKARLV